MKELATPNSVNHTDTLMPPGDCIQQHGNMSCCMQEECGPVKPSNSNQLMFGGLELACMEEVTANDRIVADTIDRAS